MCAEWMTQYLIRGQFLVTHLMEFLFVIGVVLAIVYWLWNSRDNTISSNNKSRKERNEEGVAGVAFDQRGINYDNNAWEKIRQKVFAVYGKRCNKCNSPVNLQIHHKVPKYQGGSDDVSNLIVLCESCHEKTHGREFDYDNDRDYEEDSPRIKSSKLAIIDVAMKSNKPITITYKKIDNTVTTRTIQPFEVHQWDGRIYVRAFCFLRNAKRTFRVSRIIKIS